MFNAHYTYIIYIYTVYTYLYVYSHPGVNRILTKSTNPHHLNARIATTFTTGSTVHKWDLTQIVVTHGLRCYVYIHIYIYIHAKKYELRYLRAYHLENKTVIYPAR